MITRAKIISITAAVFLFGCTHPNIPESKSFTRFSNDINVAHVFFDVNGNFYPSEWHSRISPAEIRKHKSLLNASTGFPKNAEWLKRAEKKQLDEIQQLIKNKRRVFILTHGYNNSEAYASNAFNLLTKKIKPTEEDAIIRVHWDGLVKKTFGGQGTAWFPAVGASQMVGINGLRKILNLPKNQDVYLISHSRGASVLLSALSNPSFSKDYLKKTENLSFIGKGGLSPTPIMEAENRLQMIFLAPAIGFPDFWHPRCEGGSGVGQWKCVDPPTVDVQAEIRCPHYRNFTPQLKSIRYTVNKGDGVLKKGSKKLSRYFNATDLGFNSEVGLKLRPCYSFLLQEYIISRPHGHSFLKYINDKELLDMLSESE